MEKVQRRLTTIVAADIAGFSRLVGIDEEGTLSAQRRHRKDLIDPLLERHGGRVANTAGDSLLIEFPSAVEAVRCAMSVQAEMSVRNAGVPPDRRIEYRIGINVGDVVVEDDDLLGDGVNIAARLEALAQPGGICLSGTTRDHIRDRLDIGLQDMGEVSVKNISRPVQVFRVSETPSQGVSPSRPPHRRRLLAAGIPAALFGLIAIVGLWQPWEHRAEPLMIERPAGLPAIAVLPFENISGDPEQDYFSDGITDDLITDLSRVSGLFVIARNSVFTYKGAPVRVQQIGRELGVTHVVEGSVRRAGGRVRINTQLVDASSGRQLWADRYDRDLTDVFALQDEVVQKIVSALAVRLTAGEEARLDRAAKVDPEAYDLLLRGLARFRRFTPEDNAAAREFFLRAIAVDPGFARAHADLAWSHGIDTAFGWTDDSDASLKQAIENAENALALDDSVPQVHMAFANIYRRQQNAEASIAAARRAIALDPNSADGYAQLANSLIYGGQPEAALKAVDSAARLNPRNPFFFRYILGRARFQMGDYEDAAAILLSVLERNPDFFPARLTLAAAYGQLGRADDAEWQTLEILTLQPDYSLKLESERRTFFTGADHERFIEGLRKAGLPD